MLVAKVSFDKTGAEAISEIPPDTVVVKLPAAYPVFNLYPAIYPDNLREIYPTVGVNQQHFELVKAMPYPCFDLYPAVYPHIVLYPPIEYTLESLSGASAQHTGDSVFTSLVYPNFNIYPAVDSIVDTSTRQHVAVHLQTVYPVFNLYPAVYPSFDLYPAAGDARPFSREDIQVSVHLAAAYPIFNLYPAVYPHFDIYPAVNYDALDMTSSSQLCSVRLEVHYPAFCLYPAIYPNFEIYPALLEDCLPEAKIDDLSDYLRYSLYPAAVNTPVSVSESPTSMTPILVSRYPVFNLYPVVYPSFEIYPSLPDDYIPINSRRWCEDIVTLPVHYPFFNLYPAVYPHFDLYPASTAAISVHAGPEDGITVRLAVQYPSFDLYPAVYPHFELWPSVSVPEMNLPRTLHQVTHSESRASIKGRPRKPSRLTHSELHAMVMLEAEIARPVVSSSQNVPGIDIRGTRSMNEEIESEKSGRVHLGPAGQSKPTRLRSGSVVGMSLPSTPRPISGAIRPLVISDAPTQAERGKVPPYRTVSVASRPPPPVRQGSTLLRPVEENSVIVPLSRSSSMALPLKPAAERLDRSQSMLNAPRPIGPRKRDSLVLQRVRALNSAAHGTEDGLPPIPMDALAKFPLPPSQTSSQAKLSPA